MEEREITRVKKDNQGDITAICYPGEWWSPRYSFNAIQDIDNAYYNYFVMIEDKKIFIKVVDGPNGKYSRTDPDRTTKNNLDDLPDC